MKMKHVFAGACALALLAGCSDASAKLQNSSETVMTVGNTSFSKGDLYQMMMNSIGGDEVYGDVMEYISDQEVELTDEMKEEATNMLDFYTMMYGTQFSDYLSSSGMTEDEYVEKVIIPSLKSEKLTGVYVDANFDSLCASFSPIQAIILSFTSEEDASAALSELKDGSASAAEAASAHNSTSTGTEEIITSDSLTYDSAVLSVIRSGSVDDGWVEVPSSDGSSFYLVKIVSKTPSEFKDDAVTTLSGISTVTDAATDYFLRKYSFHVYDISVYNSLKENHPAILVQDSKPFTLTAPAAE